jgi:hypothetical protein
VSGLIKSRSGGFIEVLLDSDEFKAKLDPDKPLHYRDWFDIGGPHSTRLHFKFRLYGMSRDGHVLVFERRFDESFVNAGEGQRRLNDLVEQFAKPLGATPGRLAALDAEIEAEAESRPTPT